MLTFASGCWLETSKRQLSTLVSLASCSTPRCSCLSSTMNPLTYYFLTVSLILKINFLFFFFWNQLTMLWCCISSRIKVSQSGEAWDKLKVVISVHIFAILEYDFTVLDPVEYVSSKSLWMLTIEISGHVADCRTLWESAHGGCGIQLTSGFGCQRRHFGDDPD